QLVAGLRWVRHRRVILENTLSGVVLNIVYAAVTTVFVYYAQHGLHFDAARTGLALGLAGIGPIAVATLAPVLRRRFRLGRLLLAELLVTGPLLALLDLAPILPGAPALLLVAISLGLSGGGRSWAGFCSAATSRPPSRRSCWGASMPPSGWSRGVGFRSAPSSVGHSPN